jgi:hypothetical protein
MWDPRRLTTLWVFTACYRDSFTFFTFLRFTALCTRCTIILVSHSVEMVKTPTFSGIGLVVSIRRRDRRSLFDSRLGQEYFPSEARTDPSWSPHHLQSSRYWGWFPQGELGGELSWPFTTVCNWEFVELYFIAPYTLSRSNVVFRRRIKRHTYRLPT